VRYGEKDKGVIIEKGVDGGCRGRAAGGRTKK
jgi:hypothetical protein